MTPAPSAWSSQCPAIGPPVWNDLAAISASGIGGNFPAFGPAGTTAPSTHSTASSSMPQSSAARRIISFLAVAAPP